MLNMEELAAMAAEAGFTHSAPLDVATLELKDEVRAMCSANTCRAYGPLENNNSGVRFLSVFSHVFLE